jgi:hypothetical protein
MPGAELKLDMVFRLHTKSFPSWSNNLAIWKQSLLVNLSC